MRSAKLDDMRYCDSSRIILPEYVISIIGVPLLEASEPLLLAQQHGEQGN